MSEWSEKNERIYADMYIIEGPKYNTKYFVHRVIKFLRDHPERAPDYIDFVPDWKTRDIEINQKAIETVVEGWKKEN